MQHKKNFHLNLQTQKTKRQECVTFEPMGSLEIVLQGPVKCVHYYVLSFSVVGRLVILAK